MARQETIRHRLSDQGNGAAARGETLVTLSRRRFLRTVSAGALLVATLPLGITTASAATKIQHVVSPGGIEAWFVQDATVPLVAMEYAFGGGAAQDPADKPGVSNMMAELLDEGAGDLDANTFHDRLERRAIQMSFGTSRDNLRGSLRMLKENSAEAFDLLRLALTEPRFDSEAVERIRAQIVSTLRRETTTPTSLANRAFWQLAYPDHPYGRPSNGTLDSASGIQAGDLREYKRRNLTKDSLKIAVVGDIDATTLGKLLDQTFGALPAKADLVPVPAVTATTPPKRVSIALDVPQTVVMFGGPGLKRDDPDFMTAYVVNHILGGGALSSRLYTEIREKRGLAYSVYQSLIWMDRSAVFVGTTATRADRATETVDAVDSEIRRMAEDGPTQKELDEAKSYLKGSQMLSLDTSLKIAGALLQYQLDKLPIDYIEKRNGLVDAVTLDDAKRVAKRLWGQGLLTVVIGRSTQASVPPQPSSPQPAKN
jgi:zinc protease